MSELESLEKLREAAKKGQVELPEIDWSWNLAVGERRWLNKMANAIQEEVDSAYMRLPVDEDGVPIRMGDTIEGELLFDGKTVSGTVTTLHINADDKLDTVPDTVYIKVNCDDTAWTIKELRVNRCRHVKPRTLEDVLRDFAENIDAYDGNYIDVYAAEIRELLGGSEHE